PLQHSASELFELHAGKPALGEDTARSDPRVDRENAERPAPIDIHVPRPYDFSCRGTIGASDGDRRKLGRPARGVRRHLGGEWLSPDRDGDAARDQFTKPQYRWIDRRDARAT